MASAARPLWCAALAFAVAGVSAGGHKRNLPLRWVLLEVHPETGVRVARERGLKPGPTAVDAASHSRRAHPQEDTMFSISWGVDHAREHAHFSDPRGVHHEHFDADTGHVNGTRVHHDVGYISLRIPYHISDVPHIDITEHAHDAWTDAGPRAQKRHHFEILEAGMERRHYEELNTDFPFVPELEIVQNVGPVDSTYNIVILAACYSAASREKWNADLQKTVRFMTGQTLAEGELKVRGKPLNSQPTNRYYSHFNIFAVWDEAPQDGANHPNIDGYVAEPRPNRMKCSYGTTIKRLLACNFAETYALASHAPGADLIMTLVNDEEYGGAGGGGMAWQYAGDNFERVFHHEMGHAAADLADEYDYGFSESKDLKLANCALDGNKPPWARWQAIWEKEGTSTVPFAVCSYSNYYRPKRGDAGDEECMMRSSSIANLCDVCREGLLNNGFMKPAKGVDFTVPRCPLEIETLVVRDDAIARLHVNPTMQDRYQYQILRQHWGPPFNVSWRCRSAPAGVPCNGAEILSGSIETTSLTVSRCAGGGVPGVAGCGWPGGARAPTGDYVIEVQVVDTVTDAGWTDVARNTTEAFRVRVVDAAGLDNVANQCVVRDCNKRYGRGTGDVCKNIFDVDVPERAEAACLAAGCHFDKILSTCERFYGRQPLGDEPETAGYRICTICDEGNEQACNVTFVVRPQDASAFTEEEFGLSAVNMNKFQESLEEGYWWALLIGAVVSVIMIVALIRTCSDVFETDDTQNTRCNKNARRVGMVIFGLLVWASVVMSAYGVFQWLQTDTELLADIWLILFILGGVLVFLLSVFVFAALSSRGPIRLGISVVILILTVTFLMVMTITLLELASASTGSNGSSNSTAESVQLDEIGADVTFMDDLRDAWVTSVRRFPKTVCQLEKDYRCSGFQKSCFNIRESNSYCPEDCPLGNAYTNPCVQVLQRRLNDNFITLSTLSISITVTVFVGFVITTYLFFATVCGKSEEEKCEGGDQARKKRKEEKRGEKADKSRTSDSPDGSVSRDTHKVHPKPVAAAAAASSSPAVQKRSPPMAEDSQGEA